MNNINRLRKDEAVLLVIDYQTKMMPFITDGESVVAESAKLIKGCRILNLPILVTQQYTKGLGETVETVARALTEDLGELAPEKGFEHIEKTSFSTMGEPDFEKALKATDRKSVLICGVEGHVCVRQTVLDLLALDYAVFVASDCVSSRKKRDLKPALKEMAAAGAVLISSEAALFEMLEAAGKPGFKQISNLVK
ncbi:hydrolase [Clostridia bacterium]|nr:hydrolase [Clostridia bacterium]